MGAERSVSSYQPVSGTKDTIDEQSNRDPVLAALIVATNEKSRVCMTGRRTHLVNVCDKAVYQREQVISRTCDSRTRTATGEDFNETTRRKQTAHRFFAFLGPPCFLLHGMLALRDFRGTGEDGPCEQVRIGAQRLLIGLHHGTKDTRHWAVKTKIKTTTTANDNSNKSDQDGDSNQSSRNDDGRHRC